MCATERIPIPQRDKATRIFEVSRYPSLLPFSCLMFFYLSSHLPNLFAELSPSFEYKVKGAFIYNFTKFIKWPPEVWEQNMAFTIGLFEADRFGPALEVFGGKTVFGKEVKIKHFASIDTIEFCHVLFIGSSKRNRIQNILGSLKEQSILTIGESERFIELGGIINFVIVDGKVKFEINREEARRSNLKISSDLLSLALNLQQDKNE